jgi:hypothetical protein
MAKYSPYKMKGHSLPGINQRSPLKATNEDGKAAKAKYDANYAENKAYHEKNKDKFKMDEKGQYRNTATGTTVSETRAKGEELDKKYPNRKKKSPAKQKLRELRAEDKKQLKQRKLMADDKKAKKLMAEDKTSKKKKSPGKWAQFIPMAISAVSAMNKKKE